MIAVVRKRVPIAGIVGFACLYSSQKLAVLVCSERMMRLTEVVERHALKRHETRVGRVEEILVEGPSKDTPLVWEARLECMAPEIDGKLYLNDIEVVGARHAVPLLEPKSYRTARPGDLVTVEITETHEYDLVGRVVEILDVPRAAAARAAVTGPVQRVATGAALRILA